MLFYCRFTWYPGVSRAMVARRLVQQDELGTNHPERIKAWYTLAGETCLETPDGMQVGKAGSHHVIVPAGPPMHLTATGTVQRKALVLILHDSSKPPTTPERDWKPKGLCKG